MHRENPEANCIGEIIRTMNSSTTPLNNECVASFPFAESSSAAAAHRAGEEEDDYPSSSEEEAPLSDAEAAALRALKECIAVLSHDKKSALVHVQRVKPELVDDDHLVGFLRAEDFDVDLAKKRLLRYWKDRYKVFGPDKFCLPMTLSGAMKDHIDALKQGFLTLLPVLDSAGRAIIYSNADPYKQHIPEADEKIPVWWYLLHVAMENPSVRKRGFVILANSRASRINNFDAKWTLAGISSGDRDFPIRWKRAHVCHANAVFPLIASAVKSMMSVEQRESFVLHSGSNESIVKSLAAYSLPKHCVPTDLGGTLHVSIEDFVQERLIIEGGASDFGKSSEKGTHEAEPVHSTSKASAVSCRSPPDQKLPGRRKAKRRQSNNDGNDKKKPKGRSHPGRMGDPRMKRAMQAKKDNPDLSLADALEAGGFVFPGLNVPGVKVSEIVDEEGVTFYQRRNQLLRRLRLERGKADRSPANSDT